ncbi:hypothetical protein SAMD00019534_068490 [Acytostelium subglobosum LB1]|uniref:hypothetical protein n=1 Tax=Acytostelium subglobosum LB1 TaxID=1410327 RepID=UPI000644EF90|nr:hypothetical protein SAMD00019534_068490 [Acytostelium subglobosum LB1]GAM23674.1 hypothetical protein SAMD00019534_068490 [Acytostelium subglobosum LB1]|eukprot:XP_012753415.1 hypothetical protein SAMD00019534_068490 [Acytostelium subglobosum LB1]
MEDTRLSVRSTSNGNIVHVSSNPDKTPIEVYWAKDSSTHWTFMVDKDTTVADMFENSYVVPGHYLYLYMRKRRAFGLHHRDVALCYEDKLLNIIEQRRARGKKDAATVFVVDKSKRKPSDKIRGNTNLQHHLLKQE